MPARTSFTASFNASTTPSTPTGTTTEGITANAVIAALKNGSFNAANANANAHGTSTSSMPAIATPTKTTGGDNNETDPHNRSSMERSPTSTGKGRPIRASFNASSLAGGGNNEAETHNRSSIERSPTSTGKGGPIRASFNASTGINRNSFNLEKTITSPNVPTKSMGAGNEKEKNDPLSVSKSMAEVIASSHTIIVCLSKEYKARQSCQKVAKFVRQRKMSTGQHNVYYVNMQKLYTTMTEVCLPMWDKDVLPFTADRLASMIGNKGKLRLYLTQEKLQDMIGTGSIGGSGGNNTDEEETISSAKATSIAPFSSIPNPGDGASEGTNGTASSSTGQADSDKSRLFPSIKSATSTSTTLTPFSQHSSSSHDGKDLTSDKSANGSTVSLPSIVLI